MYNYNAPPGYSRPPGSGGPPYGMAPPGMGPPPGTSVPPGVNPPPGSTFQPPALGGPRPLPPNWQAPTNMPNINLNAPVIRLGTLPSMRGDANAAAGRRESTARPARPGLGMDSNMRDGDQGQKNREPVLLIPPTREELARTIFVGNIPEGVNDEEVERILRAAGGLGRWLRATDANDKAQTFGFAEYQDAQSLETAIEIYKDVQVPTQRIKAGEVQMENGDDEVAKTKLQIMVDDNSIKYAEDWSKTRKEDEATVQWRFDSAREELTQVLASLFNPPNAPQVVQNRHVPTQDVQMHDSNGVEVAVINLSAAEDELADIPAEMREIVAAEIAAFRDRSIRRDLERLRREEELEAEERRRNARLNRASPPASAPTGPGGANGVPLGPKADRGIQGAPSGPKGSQFPRDYQQGVNFVNGGSVNNGVYIKYDDDDDSASDEEIERRRKDKIKARQDDEYQSELNRWLKQEARSAASLERTSGRKQNEEAQLQAERDAQAAKLKKWNDDAEEETKRHPYYRDRGEYMRMREKIRKQEAKEDDVEREQEQREKAVVQKQKDHARGQADAFLDQQAEELLRKETSEPQHFKMSLGAAAKKIEQATAPRRTAADVENLLENDDAADQPSTKKRALIPINFDAAVRANLTQEEILEAQKQLARDIPNDKEGLFKWPVSWEHLLNKHIDVELKNWASEKVLDTLGVHEDMLVDAIVNHLKIKGGPEALVDELSGALDEDSEALVKKLWRMVIYYSETEKRGIK